jgi:hypothetical protein
LFEKRQERIRNEAHPVQLEESESIITLLHNGHNVKISIGRVVSAETLRRTVANVFLLGPNVQFRLRDENGNAFSPWELDHPITLPEQLTVNVELY